MPVQVEWDKKTKIIINQENNSSDRSLEEIGNINWLIYISNINEVGGGGGD